jgi:MFS family permease
VSGRDDDPAPSRSPQAPARALASAPFRRLWLSMVGANGGRWAFTMLASWLAYALTHSPAWVGLTMFALQMPFIVAAPLTGVLADRMPRRRLLLLAIGVSAVAAAGASALLVAHALTPALLVVVAFVLGMGGTMQSTAQNALLPGTVAPAALFEAFALQGTARQGAEFFGPAIASPVLALFGRASALGAVAALFVAGALPVVALGLDGGATALDADPNLSRTADLDTPARGGRRRAVADLAMLVDGVRYVRASDRLGPLLLLVAAHCGLTMAYMGILPSLATAAGIAGSTAYGALMTTVGLGAVAGTLLVAVAGRRAHPGRLFALVSVLSGAGVATLGVARGPVAFEAAALLVGGATASFMAVAAARIQAATLEAMRGRVTSLYLMLAGGAMALGNALYGAVAAWVAVRAIPVASGLMFLALVVVAVSLSAPIRRLYVGPEPRPLAEAEARAQPA